MRLVSFDVGIKNLAYCVFSLSPSQQTPQTLEWSIPEWNCANLIAANSDPISNKPCCQSIKGKRKSDAEHLCNKNSKWAAPNNLDVTYCETHAKMHTEWIIPKKCHTASHINKMKLPELEIEYAKLFSSTPNNRTSTKMKKSDFAERIIAHYDSMCYRSAVEPTEKIKTAGEVDLVTIGRAIRRQLDSDPAVEDVTHVVIENQISTIAARMKTIQGMIAQYFIMRFGDKVHIEFVSSHNKLKGLVDLSAKKRAGVSRAGVSRAGVTDSSTTPLLIKQINPMESQYVAVFLMQTPR